MQKKEFIILPKRKELKLYDEYGFNTFILPLKDYSIGFNVYFDVDEINKLSKSYNIYVIMNRLLHKQVYDFDLNKFNDNIKFIIEDIGLISFIPKNRIVLYEHHILSNYKAINYLNSLDINNTVINNDLTIDELTKINNECKSNIFYFYISKNTLMYSRRALVSNFNKYYDIDSDENYYNLSEKSSLHKLTVKEEKYGSVIVNDRIFCASKYLDKLEKFNLIINLTDIDDVSEKIILSECDSENLCNLIDSDYYFLENDIKYKVGDLK